MGSGELKVDEMVKTGIDSVENSVKKVGLDGKKWGSQNVSRHTREKRSFRDQFLNATTLGQLIEIILYRKRNFMDIFQDDSSFKRTEVMLKEIKSLRDPRAHVDQSFEWTDEMVNKTKTFTMEIITPILQWFDR